MHTKTHAIVEDTLKAYASYFAAYRRALDNATGQPALSTEAAQHARRLGQELLAAAAECRCAKARAGGMSVAGISTEEADHVVAMIRWRRHELGL